MENYKIELSYDHMRAAMNDPYMELYHSVQSIQSTSNKPVHSAQDHVVTEQPVPAVQQAAQTSPSIWSRTKGWVSEHRDAIESRAMAGLSVLGDVGEMAAGVMIGGGSLAAEPFTLGTSTLGVGVGGAVILHGADEFVTDIKALWTGHREMSMTARGLSHIPGVSPAQAELIDAEISILDTWGTAGAGWAASRIGKNVPTLTKAGQTLFSEVGSTPETIADHPGSVATETKAAISNNSAALFGKTTRTDAVNYAAHDAANALRLKTTLALQDAGILNSSGQLTESAIRSSRFAMRRGSVLKNPSVVKELTKDGTNITDWKKMTTQAIKMPNGQKVQIHYYRNSITGEVNYTHPDFKVKNTIDLFPKVPEKEPNITPTYGR